MLQKNILVLKRNSFKSTTFFSLWSIHVLFTSSTLKQSFPQSTRKDGPSLLNDSNNWLLFMCPAIHQQVPFARVQLQNTFRTVAKEYDSEQQWTRFVASSFTLFFRRNCIRKFSRSYVFRISTIYCFKLQAQTKLPQLEKDTAVKNQRQNQRTFTGHSRHNYQK